MVQFISKTESETLIREMLSKRSGDANHVVSFSHENQRWRSFCLASEMVNWLGSFEHCIALVLDWGVWPSSEDMELYALARSGCGDSNPLHKRPGHWFSGEEKRRLVAFLNMFIQFGWGVRLIGGTTADVVEMYLSHDGSAGVKSTQRLLHVERRLMVLNIDYTTTDSDVHRPA